MIFRKIFATITVVLFYSCNFDSNHIGSPTASRNIEYSKSKELFLKKYNVKEIKDSLGFEVKDVWLEKSWKRDNKALKILDDVQIVIELNFKTNKYEPRDYSKSWEFSSLNKIKFGWLGSNIYWAFVNVNMDSIPVYINIYNNSNEGIEKKLAFILKSD